MVSVKRTKSSSFSRLPDVSGMGEGEELTDSISGKRSQSVQRVLRADRHFPRGVFLLKCFTLFKNRTKSEGLGG